MSRVLRSATTPRQRLLAVAALIVVIVAWPRGSDVEAAPAGEGQTPSRPSATVPVTSATTTGRATDSARPGTGQSLPSPVRTTKVARAPRLTPKPAPAVAAPGTAVRTLATLLVKGRAPRTGYERDRFGQAWADVDRNGCDTRNDILRRDLTAYVVERGTHGCLVLRGTLAEPYTGRRIAFVRGPGTSSQVQIDHVVALSDAWQKGAQQWDAGRRRAFANDPLNLLAVDGPTNLRKGDGDAATWLPPRKAYRCSYVARQVSVKHRYGLWVTAAERDAMARVLESCPGRGLVAEGRIALGGGSVQAAPQPTPSPVAPASLPSAPAAPVGGTDPRFDTCRAANAAGYGPYRRGADPEYDWYQDRDHDGRVCER
jgi:hypothetical protein